MKQKELQIVTFEQSKRLKALGFDWGCRAFYHAMGGIIFSDCVKNEKQYGITYKAAAPTVALALKWIRDEKHLNYSISCIGDYYKFITDDDLGCNYSSYEELERALLDELLTVLEKEDKQ
jgi:hypothetical protein